MGKVGGRSPGWTKSPLTRGRGDGFRGVVSGVHFSASGRWSPPCFDLRCGRWALSSRSRPVDVGTGVVSQGLRRVAAGELSSMIPPANQFSTGDALAVLADQWDQLQYECGQGPCLEAAATNGVESVPYLRTENRWPLFTRAIVDQTPVRSMLSFRLFLTEQNRAALNLYATRPGAFTEQSTATGSMFAAYASMAMIVAARNDTANHLTRALESNRA